MKVEKSSYCFWCVPKLIRKLSINELVLAAQINLGLAVTENTPKTTRTKVRYLCDVEKLVCNMQRGSWSLNAGV